MSNKRVRGVNLLVAAAVAAALPQLSLSAEAATAQDDELDEVVVYGIVYRNRTTDTAPVLSYDLEYFQRNLGMYMMTWAVSHFATAGFQAVHLGTCYSQRALYKTQFPGIQFFNGFRWSPNLDELKFLLDRDERRIGRHALELAEFQDQFYHGRIDAMAIHSTFALAKR